jgi:hypothetical protein
MLKIGFDDCPYCGSLDVFRSQQKDWKDRVCAILSALLLLERARCHYCMFRYFRPLLMPPLREYSSTKKPVRAPPTMTSGSARRGSDS